MECRAQSALAGGGARWARWVGLDRGGRWEAVGSTGRMNGEVRGSRALATCKAKCPVALQGKEGAWATGPNRCLKAGRVVD